MTDGEEIQLANTCAEIAAAARDGMGWTNDPENADLVNGQSKGMLRTLRRGARRAAKLERAARRNLSVSVFGPSQAGKSFLVSVLARPPEGRLVADFGEGGKLDYISEVNPEGEGESTGLVTRFTMRRAPAPQGFPIALSILSEADVVRTLINSFYMDGDQSETPPEPAEIDAHVAGAAPGAGPVAGLVEDEVWEIHDYVQNNFGKTAYAAALRSFWEDAADIAPRLDIAARAEFFSILWGGHAVFTALYRRLAQALTEIGHPSEVHAPIAALVPRDTSIIDVKTLHGINETGDGDRLDLHTPGGVRALPRSIVCALAAELVLPMQDEPHPLFGRLDLLDFPGARNRFGKPLAPGAGAADPVPSELFLRGKVAFLFDRYVEDQEITSMMLCIPDSNMETVDLPRLVDNWIAMTHGESPKQRAGRDCNLFFLLTKFDKHLGESAAASGASTRFERRMQASLLEKFGRGADPWVASWTPGRPFDNCFWLRNPNYFVKALYDYDENSRETLRPSEAEGLAKLREGCLAADEVQRHFADPGAAWDAAITPNDGGVSYLIERLEEVCKPDAKARQIRGQLDALRATLRPALEPFHVSSDLDVLLKEKTAAADAVIDRLETALDQHCFGALLRALMVDQEEIAERIARVPASVRIVSGGAAQPAAQRATPRRVRPGSSAQAAPEPAVEASDDTIRALSREAFQAQTAFQTWTDGINVIVRDPAAADRLCLGQGAARDLVTELSSAARRVELRARMTERLSEIGYGLTIDRQARPAALVCTEMINRFVTTLGYGDLPEAERPAVTLPEGGTRPVFAARKAAKGIDTLPAVPRASAEEFWSDWVFGLHAMFTENARSVGGQQINEAQNRRLGEILSRLEEA